MKTTIGAYDATTRTVPVTFEAGEIEHKRPVNAVVKANGDYDATATAARVADVARGVEQKILVGAITAPSEESETPAPPPVDPA